MRSRIFSPRISTSLVAAAVFWLSMLAVEEQSGTFGWGDLDGNDVTFLEVTEDNDEVASLYAPLPGTGSPFTDVNSLVLFPSQQGFASQSNDNSADSVDSTLTTIISAKSCSSLEAIEIVEFGNYSLGGLIGGQSNAVIAGSFFWTILEVDYAPVSLATQATNLILGTGSGFNGGQYSRPGDDGTEVIWSGNANIDLTGFLNSNQVFGKATAVRLTFDNTLLSSADDVSTAFIKTDFIDINVEAGVHGSQSGIPTDCDNDFDADGADFLLLQRRIPELIPLWELFYGTGGNAFSATSTAVPEPNSLLLVALSSMCSMTCSRRR